MLICQNSSKRNPLDRCRKTEEMCEVRHASGKYNIFRSAHLIDLKKKNLVLFSFAEIIGVPVCEKTYCD